MQTYGDAVKFIDDLQRAAVHVPPKQEIKKLRKKIRKRFERMSYFCRFKKTGMTKHYKDSVATICGFISSTLSKEDVVETGNHIVVYAVIENHFHFLKGMADSMIKEKDDDTLIKFQQQVMDAQNELIRFLYSNYEKRLRWQKIQSSIL